MSLIRPRGRPASRRARHTPRRRGGLAALALCAALGRGQMIGRCRSTALRHSQRLSLTSPEPALPTRLPLRRPATARCLMPTLFGMNGHRSAVRALALPLPSQPHGESAAGDGPSVCRKSSTCETVMCARVRPGMTAFRIHHVAPDDAVGSKTADLIRLTLSASVRTISRPSHRFCVRSQISCVEGPPPSQPICIEKRLDCASGR